MSTRTSPFPSARAQGCLPAALLATVLLAATLLASLLAPPVAVAQPYLVTDLDTTPTGSDPESFVALGGLTYFSAKRSDVGAEVFVSDGTAEGTRLLVDANPGLQSSYRESDYDQRPIAVAGNTVFFLAQESFAGTRLWATTPDGGAAPLRGAEASIGDALFAAELLGTLGSRLLFAGWEAATGEEPWVSDGTEAGTVSLGDLVAGQDGSRPRNFAVFGGAAYFTTSSVGSYAEELWRTDGTAAGTRRVDGPFTSTCRIFPDGLAASAHGVIFEARTEATGCEPWVSDGTEAGTRLLRDLLPGPYGYGLGAVLADDGRVFFTYGQSLWLTDGTEAGTVRLLADGVRVTDNTFAVAGDRLVFAATSAARGVEPWSSDGTPAGTFRLVDLYPGSLGSHPEGFTTLGDQAVFSARTPEKGVELWITDGTAQGTRLLADIAAGPASSRPRARGLGDQLWIRADDGVFGPEPWISDGTLAGTRQLLDLDSDGTATTNFRNLFPVGDQAVFDFFAGADDPLDPERDRLWVSDGTEQGTLPMQDPPGLQLAKPRLVAPAAGAIYFTAHDPSIGTEVLRFDGSAPPAVFDLEPGPTGSNPQYLTVAGDTLFFARRLESDLELWRLNPSGASATFLAALRVETDGAGATSAGGKSGGALNGPYLGWAERFFAFGDRIAAFVYQDLNGDSIAGPEDEAWLWASDGTAEGTRRLRRAFLLIALRSRPVVLGDELLFFTLGEGGFAELWRTDGTERGTVLVSRFDQRPEPIFPAYLLSHRDHAFFGFEHSGGHHTWRTDGTGEGTEKLDVDRVGQAFSGAGHLFFTPPASIATGELWRLTGEPPRAEQVATWPESSGGQPEFVADTPGVAYFIGKDHATGAELWRTDGTAEGTRLVGDIAAGPERSAISHVAVAKRQLLFTADDGIHGRELWAAPLRCVPTPETLCLGDGRFQVRARWRDSLGDFGVGQARTRPLTGDSGAFWFFDPANIELAVKVLDGRALTGAFWVFYASLSNVEFELEVFDTETGELAVYENEAGTLASVGDTAALPAAGTAPVPKKISPPAAAPADARGTCQPAPEILCLGDGRFRVTAQWQDFDGGSGTGVAGNLSDDTGTFWFFDDQNVELLIKILDGNAVNGHHWVFYASLSNVEFSITVEDLETGRAKTYGNPAGSFASRADTETF